MDMLWILGPGYGSGARVPVWCLFQLNHLPTGLRKEVHKSTGQKFSSRRYLINGLLV